MKLITFLIAISSLFLVIYTKKPKKQNNKKSNTNSIVLKSNSRKSESQPKNEPILMKIPDWRRIKIQPLRTVEPDKAMIGKNYY